MPDDKFNEYCGDLLAEYKRRNGKAVAGHIKGLCDILRQEGNHVVQMMFGGSVRKNTYVTGLSDVDVLLIVNESSLVNQPPSKVKRYVEGAIRQRLPRNPVSVGKLAVTVKYADGIEIQVLPAIRTDSDGIRIARPGSRKWSNIARPDRFAEKLAQVNAARDGSVVPVIKLAKAMADCFITDPDRKIGGYHIESLAVDAFKGYQGPTDPKAMLIHLLGHSIEAVMAPLTDSTGQSRYVDEALGSAGSGPRKRASTYFGQMRGKVRRCKTKSEFNDLFCEG